SVEPGLLSTHQYFAHHHSYSLSHHIPLKLTNLSGECSITVTEEVYEAGGIPVNPFIDNLDTRNAGAKLGRGDNLFAKINKERISEGSNENTPWAPFINGEEWGLVQWLMSSGLSQSEIDKYLKLDMIIERDVQAQNRPELSFKDK
ncbi:hypothetical protein BC835DRAFT_1455357, partial [Cytidiella melzeri]